MMERPGNYFGAALLHSLKLLLLRCSHRDKQAPPLCKLRNERRRNFRSRRGDHDGLVGRIVRPSQSSIADVYSHVVVAQPLQPLATHDRQLFLCLNRLHLARQQRQHRRLVTRPRSDLQQPLAA
jgi:hypothetical protein